jgi:hypothetical protein
VAVGRQAADRCSFPMDQNRSVLDVVLHSDMKPAQKEVRKDQKSVDMYALQVDRLRTCSFQVQHHSCEEIREDDDGHQMKLEEVLVVSDGHNSAKSVESYSESQGNQKRKAVLQTEYVNETHEGKFHRYVDVCVSRIEALVQVIAFVSCVTDHSTLDRDCWDATG